MTPVQTEIETPQQTRLVTVTRPYSANGKVYHFDIRWLTGNLISHARLEFEYSVEYMPRLGCHRAKRSVIKSKYPSRGMYPTAYITASKRWNKHVDMPSMIEAIEVLELLISEEVAKWS